MRKILSLVLGLLWTLPVWGALPSGYTQLEYIESTGTQSIDTGIEVNASKLTSGMRMELDIQFLSTNRQNGGNGVTAGPYFWIAYYHPGQLYCGLGNLYPSITVSQNVFSRHSYVLDSALKNFYIDDVLVESYDISEYKGTGKTNITLFNIGTSFYVKQKLYKASIYQANNLVGNFIPAKRNSDGAVGLYDTVSGEFFENSGSGEFVAGPVAEIKIATTKYNETAFSPLNTALANAISVVDSVVSNTITQAGRIATLQAQKQTRPNDIADDNEKCPAGKKCLLVEDASGIPHWYEIVEQYSRLPDGYTELEYIESTGTQYIDTGVNIGEDIQTKVRFGKTTNTFSRFGFIIGGKGNYQGLVSRTDRDSYYASMYNSSEHTLTRTITDDVFDFTFNVAGHKVVLNDTEIGTLTPISPYSTDGNVGVFRSPGTSSSNNNGIGKVYLFVITNSLTNVMLFNGIPAKRNSDGAVGLYDTVSGRFFTNQGTGEFIAGPVAE